MAETHEDTAGVGKASSMSAEPQTHDESSISRRRQDFYLRAQGPLIPTLFFPSVVSISKERRIPFLVLGSVFFDVRHRLALSPVFIYRTSYCAHLYCWSSCSTVFSLGHTVRLPVYPVRGLWSLREIVSWNGPWHSNTRSPRSIWSPHSRRITIPTIEASHKPQVKRGLLRERRID